MSNVYRSVLTSGGGVQPTGDAVAADVLTGKTFSNASAVGIAGTMPNNGAVSGQATPSQPYTIPAGYHNGSGVVTAEGAEVNYDFTVEGASYPTIGTNFTIGKHYIVAVQANTLPTSFTGATVIDTVDLPVNPTGRVYALTATATTITMVGIAQQQFNKVIAEY